jgi:uncharacterized protein
MIRSLLRRYPVRSLWLLAVLLQFPIIALLLLTGAEHVLSDAITRTGIAFNTDLVTAARLLVAAPETWLAVLLAIAQVAAPDLALIAVAGLGVGWAALKAVARRYRFWSLEVGWSRGLRVWLACLLVFSGMNLATAALHQYVLHTPGFVWEVNFFSLGFVLVFLTAMFLDAGGLFEESAWRGFALPKLQARFGLAQWGPLWASVVLGVLWSLWHMPVKFNLIFDYGWFGFGLMFTVLTLKFVLISVIMTYFFNASGESIFIAIVMHGLSNDSVRLGGLVTDEAFRSQMWAETALVIPMLVVALALTVWTRGRLGMARRALEVNRHPA